MLTLGREGPMHPHTVESASAYSVLGVDNSFSLEDFKKGFSILMNREVSRDEHFVFDMVGIDAPLANAFRRLMLSDVPTVAIETVHMHLNTGVIQDEVLSHRLGLIPLKINPDMLKDRRENGEMTEENTIKFTLQKRCESGVLSIYSGDLKWEPLSDTQLKKFKDAPPQPVIDNILITKLKPGQEVHCELFCEKGIGRVHAKWSPVCTASYRLKPVIAFPKGEVTGKDAEELVSLCPMKVFDLEDLAPGHRSGDSTVAVAARPRHCTSCRACFERFPDRVEVNKIKNHFIFSVESTGAIPAAVIFDKAIGVLIDKCERTRGVLQSYASQAAPAQREKKAKKQVAVEDGDVNMD
eukprot:GDKI01049012.1.p1 GENE.GDKI01049012.1~~GDKI01049012.1.p1  ORF type:complete len:392 (+),score=109.76 GDKI01049012.1:119-1177(+)